MTTLHLEMWTAALWAVKILWIIKQIIKIILTSPQNYTQFKMSNKFRDVNYMKSNNMY